MKSKESGEDFDKAEERLPKKNKRTPEKMEIKENHPLFQIHHQNNKDSSDVQTRFQESSKKKSRKSLIDDLLASNSLLCGKSGLLMIKPTDFGFIAQDLKIKCSWCHILHSACL